MHPQGAMISNDRELVQSLKQLGCRLQRAVLRGVDTRTYIVIGPHRARMIKLS